MRLIKIYTCIDIFTSIKCQNGYVNINIFLSLRSIENFRHSYSYTKKNEPLLTLFGKTSNYGYFFVCH